MNHKLSQTLVNFHNFTDKFTHGCVSGFTPTVVGELWVTEWCPRCPRVLGALGVLGGAGALGVLGIFSAFAGRGALTVGS